MSDVKRYWVATQALYEKEWVGVEGLVVSAGDHDAKVAALEAECAALAAGACDGVVGDDYGNAYCKYKAELAALKGAAGKEPEVVAWKTPSGNLYADKAVAEAGWRGHIRKATPLMTVAQHQRIVAAMARDAEGLVQALEWYAEKVKECRKIGPTGDTARQALDLDGGFLALDALAAHRAGKEGKA